MKRVISGLIFGVIILVIASAGLYYWIGMSFESGLTASSAQFTNTEKGISSRIVSYDNALINSTAIQEVSLDLSKTRFAGQDASAPAAPVKVMLKHTIYHGPFTLTAPDADLFKPVAAVIETELKPDHEYTSVIQTFTAPEKPFSATTTVHFDGSYETRFSVSPVNHTNPHNNATFKWTGMKGNASVNNRYKEAAISFDAGGISADTGESLVVIDGISGNFKGEYATASGDASLIYKVNRFFVKESEDAAITSANGFIFNVGSKTDAGNNTNVYMDTKIDKLTIEGDEYGPGELRFDIRHLDTNVLTQIQQEIKKTQNEMSQQGLPPEMLPLALQPIFMKALPELLKKQPEIEISRLNLNTPSGSITGNLKISIDNLEQADINQQPMELINAVTAQTSLSCPIELAKKIMADKLRSKIASDMQVAGSELSPEELELQLQMTLEQQLAAYQQQGFINIQGEHITADARLSKGQLEYNGRTLPLMALLGGGRP